MTRSGHVRCIAYTLVTFYRGIDLNADSVNKWLTLFG